MSSVRPVTANKLMQIIEGNAIPDRTVLKTAFKEGVIARAPLAKALNCNPSDVLGLWEHKNMRRIQDALRTCMPTVA